MNELVEKLRDPALRWYIWRHFGTRVWDDVTGTNQTLSICDDLICLPTRFSEYFRWWDPSTNSPGNRMFDKEEAWDHTKETNPTTTYPYDASTGIQGVIGYGGYLIGLYLTNGTDRFVIHLVRKYRQVLISNRGYYYMGIVRRSVNIPVKVYFPPTSLNLAYTTNGTVQADGVVIESGQYVLFYPQGETPYDIDIANGLFATSPIGSNPMYSEEIYLHYRSPRGHILLPKVYLGIPAAGLPANWSLFSNILIEGGSQDRGGINVSGIIDIHPFVDVYDDDPYCWQRTWAGDKLAFTVYVGYALDDANNARFILASGLAYKHTTKKELKGIISKTYLYDASSKEMYIIGVIRPLIDMYSYGRVGSVWTPSLVINSYYWTHYHQGLPDATKVVYVKPDDTVDTKTTPATTTWEYTDAYGFCNVWNDKAMCYEIMALYTDDYITIDPKDVGFCRNSIALPMMVKTDQIKPYMGRVLNAGKTYFAMARVWFDLGGQTDTYYADRIKKYTPKVLTPSEWNNLMTSIPPYTLTLVGGAPHPDIRVLTYTVPSRVTPGQTITITGKVADEQGVGEPSASVYVFVVDPDTGEIVRQGEAVTGADGTFSIDIQAPTTPKTYRVYIVARKYTGGIR
ncbi:MAG: carboxypeptidase-like regulatory domain-containing protein [Thermofilaceae archaeon]